MYRRASAFPDLPTNNGPGSDPFNEHLRRQHEADLREMDAQRVHDFESSPWAQQRQQRQQIIALVDERVAEKFNELVAGLDDDMLARVRAMVNRDNETKIETQGVTNG